MQTAQRILDFLLGLLLSLGCALALPIYWWLFVTPIVSFWKQYRANRAKLANLTA